MTILLSLTIFLNTVSEIIPITSDSPLIGTYFNCIMFMVASSVVTTIMILNYHHRRPETHDMPDWVRQSDSRGNRSEIILFNTNGQQRTVA